MCSCDMYPPSVYREKTMIARKQHNCCECRAVISPGDQYQNIFGVWDGSSETFKTCLKCATERDQLTKEAREVGDCGPCLGELRIFKIDLAANA